MIATLGIEVFLDKQCFVVDPFVHYDYVLVSLVLYRFPFFLAFLLVPGIDMIKIRWKFFFNITIEVVPISLREIFQLNGWVSRIKYHQRNFQQ